MCGVTKIMGLLRESVMRLRAVAPSTPCCYWLSYFFLHTFSPAAAYCRLPSIRFCCSALISQLLRRFMLLAADGCAPKDVSENFIYFFSCCCFLRIAIWLMRYVA